MSLLWYVDAAEMHTFLTNLYKTPNLISSDENIASAHGSRQNSPENASRDGERDDMGEANAAEVGSTGSIDIVNIDTDKEEVRTTGHMGKSSSVAWAKRATMEVDSVGKEATPLLGRAETGFALASYHTDDEDIEFVFTGNADPFEWPDPQVADELVKIYFDHCHEVLPVLDKTEFMKHYDGFSRNANWLADTDAVWLGTFNTVFAISSFYCHMLTASIKGDYFQHLWYFARAKKLCMAQDIWFSDARMVYTRALGLITLYYIITGRMNRYVREYVICKVSR